MENQGGNSIITVTNFKGGTGKTMISRWIAMLLGYRAVEVDPYGSLQEMLGKERCDRLSNLNEKIPEKYFVEGNDESYVFDFGGFDDARLRQAIPFSDLVIVPFIPSAENIQTTLDTLETISEIDEEAMVLMVANMVHLTFSDVLTGKVHPDVEAAMGVFADNTGLTLDFYQIPYSHVFQKEVNTGKTIRELSKQPLMKRAYNVHNKIINGFLDKVKVYT